MARLARAQPHRPVLPAGFVAAPSTPVAIRPLIRSRAVQAASSGKRPNRILGQRFVTPPPSTGPVVSQPLIRSRAYANQRAAYLLSSQSQRGLFPPPPPPPPPPPFPTEGDRGLMLRVGVKDGIPVHALIDGFCSDLAPGDRAVGLVVGVDSDGRPILAFSKQKCEAGTGHLEVGQRYIGLVTGVDSDGRPIISSFCKRCEPGTGVSSCFGSFRCNVCCTLSATVEVGDSGDVYAWTTPLDIDMICGGVIERNVGWYCIDDDTGSINVPHLFNDTYAEKNTIGSPEAYSGGGVSGTREVKTDIWSTGEFAIDGTTYRMVLWRSGGTVYQTSPSVVTTDFCFGGWILQRLVTSGFEWSEFGEYWVQVTDSTGGLEFGAYLAVNDYAWVFTESTDNPYGPFGCPVGYTYNSGDLNNDGRCGLTGGGYTGGGSSSGAVTDCPVALTYESYKRLTGDPDDDAHRIKCARVSIADLCE